MGGLEEFKGTYAAQLRIARERCCGNQGQVSVIFFIVRVIPKTLWELGKGLAKKLRK